MRLPETTTTRVELAPPYDGFWIEVDDDPEMGVFEDMLSGDLGRVFVALAAMTKASNAVNRDGEPADLTQPAGWRRQRRSFTLAAITKIREAWALPKAISNGSATQSPSAAAPLRGPTTS